MKPFSRPKQLQRDLRRALQADPAANSYHTSSNRLQSLAFALAGFAYMARHQKNTRLMALATIAVVLAGLWLSVDASGWIALVLAIALVWLAEFLNAAIEAAVNLAAPTYHPLARTAKDVAAGAVLVAAVAAAVLGAIILGPPTLDKLNVLLTSYSGAT